MQALTLGEAQQKLLLASSAGYGFVAVLEALSGRNKAGKQVINLDEDARVLQPAALTDIARDRVVVVTSAGHLLMFSAAELPELERGKGLKLIEIPKARRGADGECVVGVAVVPEGGAVTLYAGQRKLGLKWADLVAYGGARAGRGGLLPRGLRGVDRIECD